MKSPRLTGKGRVCNYTHRDAVPALPRFLARHWPIAVKIVEKNLHRLFKEYMTKFDVVVIGSSSHGCDDEVVEELKESDMFDSSSACGLEKTQLHLYLEESIVVL
ncbi:hypothetical protein T459_00958 [Capsicum annuum]|uniref:Uncharacterized protein n=1 Tax=Capsicum annuum TaxID=4072 RepID=A0A2G3AFR3_CAPAN|nr:hypothetical protein T459_00958 [Capsicum annuum]